MELETNIEYIKFADISSNALPTSNDYGLDPVPTSYNHKLNALPLHENIKWDKILSTLTFHNIEFENFRFLGISLGVHETEAEAKTEEEEEARKEAIIDMKNMINCEIHFNINGKPYPEINDSIASRINVIKNIVFYDCKINNLKLKLNYKIDSIKFKGEVNNISIDNSHIDTGKFELYGKCGKINISNSYFEKKLKIRNKETTKGKKENPKINIDSLKIKDCEIGSNTYLRFGFLNCNNFLLSNLRIYEYAEVNIGECMFGTFRLTNFRNMGKFKIFNTESQKNIENTKFQIDNTSIGNADFQNINLKSFNKVVMYANIFSNLHYTIIKWKDDILADDKNSIEQRQDTYRTLKNVAIKNNDRPQALIFFAQEMKNHKELMLEKNDEWLNGDIWTLRFNEWTNEFGLSWIIPLALLLILSSTFYVWLLGSIGMDINEIISIDSLGEFFIFINPIHKVGFICEDKWDDWSYMIDGTFRLFEGLLIYQTIQGFRKYSRNL